MDEHRDRQEQQGNDNGALLRLADIKGSLQMLQAVKSPAKQVCNLSKSTGCESDRALASLIACCVWTLALSTCLLQQATVIIEQSGLSIRWEDASKTLQSSIFLRTSVSAQFDHATASAGCQSIVCCPQQLCCEYANRQCLAEHYLDMTVASWCRADLQRIHAAGPQADVWSPPGRAHRHASGVCGHRRRAATQVPRHQQLPRVPVSGV